MRARAFVCPITVQASPSVEARLGVALIDVILAVAAGETRQAEASEHVDSIHAGAAVEARTEGDNRKTANLPLCANCHLLTERVELPVGAVVGVDLTVDAAESRRTGAGVAVNKIGAVGTILARVTLALIDVLLTPRTPEARQTRARETIDAVTAQTAVATRI